jgi:hypothetical protein
MPSHPVARPEPSPTAFRRRGWVAGIALAAVAASAITFIQIHAPSGPAATTGSGPVPGLTGSLVYAAHDPSGWVLWSWDLATGAASEGPHVEHPIQLVGASGASPGWIGVTSIDGRRRIASVVHSLTPASSVSRIATGDLVTWTAAGEGVTSLDFGPRTTRCARHVVIRSHVVSFGTEEVRFDGSMCGLPLTIASDGTLDYVVAAHGPSASIQIIGNDSMRPFMDDHVLVSVSTNDDFLVTPVPRPGEVPRGSPPPGLQLFHRSPLSDGPVSFGSSQQPLQTQAFLAWSWDAGEAYVLGSYDGVRGVYGVTMGPGVALRQPELLDATDAVSVEATVTSSGGVFLLLDGSLSYEHEGQIVPLALPAGAPRPAGPMLWAAAPVTSSGLA